MSSYRDTAELEGAFQVGKKELLEVYPFRGMQPSYADNEEDPESLIYEGMIAADGNLIQKTTADMNVCALTSTCVRYGYVDLSLARSVSRDFYERKKVRAGVKKHDVLVNSTGDGTIGRVAVYDYDIPAVVDGHITILRYKN